MVTATRPRSGPVRSYRFPEFYDERLSSGIRLITAPVSKLPVVTVLVVVDAGAAADPVGKEGTAALVAASLVEGTQRANGAELSERFEQLGTSLESAADWDSAFVKITVLADKLDEATRLLGEVLSIPAFPEREVERLKSERLAAILQLETEPRGLADEKFSEFVFSAQSRYSQPEEGSARSVGAIRREDVESFYRANYLASGTTVIIAGDVTRESARNLVTVAFSSIGSGTLKRPELSAAPRSDIRKLHLVSKVDAPQSELRIGHVGLPRLHPDFFPTVVMNAVLGGLFGSRINLNLREVHGYTYGASSYFDWRRQPGPFAVSTAVASDVSAAALREILLEIDRIRSERIADSELSLAKDYLEGIFPIRYETTSAIASALASLVIYHLPADYYDAYRRNIHAVSADAVLAAARAHIHPDRLQTVVVGDAAAIRESLAQLELGAVEIHDG
jgi:zinc protease